MSRFEVSWLLGQPVSRGGGARLARARRGGRRPGERRSGAGNRRRGFRLEVRGRFARELVVVGIGGPGMPATIDDLAEGLATACRLVQHGGKIVVLSRVQERIGPAASSLIDIDDPKSERPPFAATRGTTTSWRPAGWPRPWRGPTCSF